MQRHYLAALLLPAWLLSGPVLAADIAVPRAGPPPRVAAFSWTNFYFGVNAGYAWSRAQSEVRLGAVTISTTTDNLSGAVGGLQSGFNFQFGYLVVGAEADYQYTAQKISKGVIVDGFPGTEEDRLQPFVTVRGRVGVGIDRWLVYVTGGGAHQSVEVRQNLPGVGLAQSAWGRWGWVAGAGIEVAPYDQISLRLEYLYLDSGKVTFLGNRPLGALFDWQLQNNVVRIAANFLL
jgi:outer membrane immunogenic protein